MYKAELQNGELVITEISPEIYKRISTQGLGHSKVGAIEILKHRIMKQFEKDLICSNWQSLQYVKDYSDAQNPIMEEI
jgi:hypothetical protein